MANISDVVRVVAPLRIDRPIYDHRPLGWYAPNSSMVSSCVPTYRNSGGGVCADSLTDLPTAVNKCIGYLNHRIAEAEKLKAQLVNLPKEIINGPL